MTYNLTVSVVLYLTDILEIENLITIFKKSELKLKVFFIDNSPTNDLRRVIPFDDTFQYIYMGKNLGFGSGHNVAINKAKGISEFHLILNSDLNFEPYILEEMYSYMKAHGEVGLIAPKVLNADGSVQYTAKLLPTPANLFVRRFIPIKWMKQKMDNLFELRFFGFDKIVEVPFLLGCFLFINTKVFKTVPGFDERYFMYMEDIDLTRRIHEHYKTLYFPKVSIYHEHGRASYKNRKLMKAHLLAAIKYFNKWGWFFDKGRKQINIKVLSQF